MIALDHRLPRTCRQLRGGNWILFLGLTCASAGLACRKQATPAATDAERQTYPSSIYLTVRGAPPGAEVRFEGESLGPASRRVSLPYTVSPLEVTVVAPGYEPATMSVIPDRERQVDVDLKPLVDAKPTARPAPRP